MGDGDPGERGDGRYSETVTPKRVAAALASVVSRTAPRPPIPHTPRYK